jgi:cytochrome b561
LGIHSQQSMTLRNTTDRYGSLTIGLHWLMLLLLVAVYACINLSDAFPKGSELRDGLKTWHYTLGLCVFVLAGLRLAVNLTDRAPAIEPDPPEWQRVSARVVHVALYALMIGLPLIGWLLLSARGRPIPFFALELPALIGADRTLGRTIKDVHEAVATAGYFLIGMHAVAALFHHYVAGDDTLRRMLPKWASVDR